MIIFMQGLIDDIPTCQVLLDRLVAEAEAMLMQGPSFVKPKSSL